MMLHTSEAEIAKLRAIIIATAAAEQAINAGQITYRQYQARIAAAAR